MSAEELRQLNQGELQRKLEEARKELITLRVQHASQQLKNPLKLRQVRRQIARVLTIMREGKKVEPKKN